MAMKLSPTMENYLRTIRSLEGKDGTVRSVDIATSLGVSRPSVHTALERLSRIGLVRHGRYSTVSLTKPGRDAADDILEKRDLARRLLTEAPQSNQKKLQAEICAIEHLSRETLSTLVERLEARADLA